MGVSQFHMQKKDFVLWRLPTNNKLTHKLTIWLRILLNILTFGYG